jgi:hypothetical protein
LFRIVLSCSKSSRKKLSLDEKSALALGLELTAQGYVELPDNGAYRITDKGKELVRAGSVSRKTAKAALAGLLQRAERYNSDANKVLTIETVVVFGSFIGTNERLGDLDIAVKCCDRDLNEPNRAETRTCLCRAVWSSL